jgi:hypothetical protein
LPTARPRAGGAHPHAQDGWSISLCAWSLAGLYVHAVRADALLNRVDADAWSVRGFRPGDDDPAGAVSATRNRD